MKQLSIIGAGWAGLAAAVAATQAGWHVKLYEAAGTAGGRARSLQQNFAGMPLDNGQHVLIGAYKDTLALMRTVGLDPDHLLERTPLDLRFRNNEGLHLPDWGFPLNLLAGLVRTKGWSWGDKASLIQTTWKWKRSQFDCNGAWTVAQLCADSNLSPRVIKQLINPLCISALNTPIEQASGAIFLRVLQDALLTSASADLLIPKVDLGALFTDACLAWLDNHGAHIKLSHRVLASHVEELQSVASDEHSVLLACPPWEAARLAANISPQWAHRCAELTHNPIATVYLHCKDRNFCGLPRPMIALYSTNQAPAQFLFDRGALTGQHGLLAAVASACSIDRDELADQVHDQIKEQVGLNQLEIIQTVVEKRATLACTPFVDRPQSFVADGVWACGDYIYSGYPSTLEGAVRSGQQTFEQLNQLH